MEARKFAVGDQVRLLVEKNGSENPTDVYTISRELPPMANVWQYRAKRVGDSQERAVNEQQLAKVGPRTWASMSAAQAQQDNQRMRNARATARARVIERRLEQTNA